MVWFFLHCIYKDYKKKGYSNFKEDTYVTLLNTFKRRIWRGNVYDIGILYAPHAPITCIFLLTDWFFKCVCFVFEWPCCALLFNMDLLMEFAPSWEGRGIQGGKFFKNFFFQIFQNIFLVIPRSLEVHRSPFFQICH